MNRDTPMLLAPHATQMHSLMAAYPGHLVAGLVGGVILATFALFLLWTVTTTGPRRSR